MSYRTRFAPSPTGPLHLGHAYSALLAQDRVFAENGDFLLRIDDLDLSRSRREWETQLKDDLDWLGLWWPEPCRRESEHHGEYDAALDRLWAKGLLYPCTCTRRDIREALSAPQDHRLNGAESWEFVVRFAETGRGPAGETGTIEFDPTELVQTAGDVVLFRRDSGSAYHLAVVVDDAAQEISEVVRGQDLFEATKIHVLLQRLLNLPTPNYHHHRLIRDDEGKRLAKRDDARAIAKYRADGKTPEDIRRMVGL